MSGEANNNRFVFVDFKALNATRVKALGRPLTEVEKSILADADKIRIDAFACRRTVAATVANIEEYGGKVTDAVKSFLGLIPPTN